MTGFEKELSNYKCQVHDMLYIVNIFLLTWVKKFSIEALAFLVYDEHSNLWYVLSANSRHSSEQYLALVHFEQGINVPKQLLEKSKLKKLFFDQDHKFS